MLVYILFISGRELVVSSSMYLDDRISRCWVSVLYGQRMRGDQAINAKTAPTQQLRRMMTLDSFVAAVDHWLPILVST
jgi:hypothetical protein